MQLLEQTLTHLDARVVEVLPRLGLAYVIDEDDRTWGVTRSTPGAGLDTLEEGQRVRIDVERHPSFSIVRRCEMLN